MTLVPAPLTDIERGLLQSRIDLHQALLDSRAPAILSVSQRGDSVQALLSVDKSLYIEY